MEGEMTKRAVNISFVRAEGMQLREQAGVTPKYYPPRMALLRQLNSTHLHSSYS